jgi:hypothetical protein
MIMSGNILIIGIGGLVALLFFSLIGLKRNSIIGTIATLRLMDASEKLASANYRLIKALLKDAKPLVRLRFRLLVGAKRYQDYTFHG